MLARFSSASRAGVDSGSSVNARAYASQASSELASFAYSWPMRSNRATRRTVFLS